MLCKIILAVSSVVTYAISTCLFVCLVFLVHFFPAQAIKPIEPVQCLEYNCTVSSLICSNNSFCKQSIKIFLKDVDTERKIVINIPDALKNTTGFLIGKQVFNVYAKEFLRYYPYMIKIIVIYTIVLTSFALVVFLGISIVLTIKCCMTSSCLCC